MEEAYVDALKLVSSKYDTNYEHFNMLVVALTTLLYKYKDHKEIVYDVFDKTSIFISEDTVYETLKNKNIDIVDFEEEELKINEGDVNATFGTSSFGYDYDFVDDRFILSERDPFIVCTSNCTDMCLLNTFVHEFNHLIKGWLNNLEVLNGSYTIRCGIDYYKCVYDNENDLFYEYDYFDALDEGINVIQTTEILENILILDVLDPYHIHLYLDELEKDEIGLDIGYSICVKEIRKLWKNNAFKSLIEDNILEGNIDKIIEEFDSVMGENSFMELGDLLDELNDLDDSKGNNKKIRQVKSQIRKMISEYNRKTINTYKK